MRKLNVHVVRCMEFERQKARTPHRTCTRECWKYTKQDHLYTIFHTRFIHVYLRIAYTYNFFSFQSGCGKRQSQNEWFERKLNFVHFAQQRHKLSRNATLVCCHQWSAFIRNGVNVGTIVTNVMSVWWETLSRFSHVEFIHRLQVTSLNTFA